MSSRFSYGGITPWSLYACAVEVFIPVVAGSLLYLSLSLNNFSSKEWIYFLMSVIS